MIPSIPVLVPAPLAPPPASQPDFSAVLQALAAAGQALAAAASALAGLTGVNAAAGPIGAPGGQPGGQVAPVLVLPPADRAPGLLLPELMNEFLISRARAGRSRRYLNHLHGSCNAFGRGRSKVLASEITAKEIESWLSGQAWGWRSRKGCLLDLRTLFGFGVKRGYLSLNPAAGVEMPQGKESAGVQVHSPGQVRQVLECARALDLNLCRCLAIRYFAGLRSSEANKLEESEIFTERGFIEIKKEKAKTRCRRLVTIPPNLKAWLALGGSLPLRDVNIRLAKFVKVCGVPWPHNVTRHSFVSYHLAKSKNAAASALEAGHTETMLFSVYRELVTPEAAGEFWALVPA